MNTDKEEQKQFAVGITKAAIGAIPVAGGLLNQLVFDIRGKVKQARYNSFTAELADYINSHYDVQLDIAQIEQEQIGDFFESVVIQVVKTSAKKRIDALKKLLAHQIVNPDNFDYAEVLAELLAGMSEYELMILQKIAEDGGTYADHYSDYYNAKSELDILLSRRRERQRDVFDEDDSWITSPADSSLQRQIEEQEGVVKGLHDRLQEMNSAYKPSTYNLDAPTYHFHLTQLLRKGIIADESGGLGASASTVVVPNQVAFDMLAFLTNEKS